jgi:hypothetical protein
LVEGMSHEPNGLASNDQQAVALQAVDLYSAGDADDGGLIFAGGEVASLLGGSWAGPIGPVADEESEIEDLEQEGGQGRVGFQNPAATRDQGFQAAGSYWLISPPRTGRRWIRP